MIVNMSGKSPYVLHRFYKSNADKRDKCRAETDAEQKHLCLPSYSASKQTSLILKEVANEIYCPIV